MAGELLSEMRCRDILIVTVPEEKNLNGHPFRRLLLATGTSVRHCRAVAEGLIFQLGKRYPGRDFNATRPSRRARGIVRGKWDVAPEDRRRCCRRFSRIERGWKRAEATGWEVVDLSEPGPGILVSIMTQEAR